MGILIPGGLQYSVHYEGSEQGERKSDKKLTPLYEAFVKAFHISSELAPETAS